MRKQQGFALIELLVVVAILGVIAAVVGLNITGFFERGTLQAAKTELHQAQTAIVSAMAAVESNNISVSGTEWVGQPDYVVVWKNKQKADAADYCYGPFRAAYEVSTNNSNSKIGAIVYGDSSIDGGWGDSVVWNATVMNWQIA